MFSRDKKARIRIEELEDRFRKLEKDFEGLQLEWTVAYDKLRHMMGRVAKRAEVLQKEMDGGSTLSPSEEAIRDDLAAVESGAGPLSPSQKRLQAQIMRMRAVRKVAS